MTEIYQDESQCDQTKTVVITITPEIRDKALRMRNRDPAVAEEFTKAFEVHWPTYCDLVDLANFAAKIVLGD